MICITWCGKIQIQDLVKINYIKSYITLRRFYYEKKSGIFTFDRFIACLSMSQLIPNLIFAWIDHNKKPTKASLLLPEGIIYSIVYFMVWIFYIPSQVVLMSSYLADRADA